MSDVNFSVGAYAEIEQVSVEVNAGLNGGWLNLEATLNVDEASKLLAELKNALEYIEFCRQRRNEGETGGRGMTSNLALQDIEEIKKLVQGIKYAAIGGRADILSHAFEETFAWLDAYAEKLKKEEGHE